MQVDVGGLQWMRQQQVHVVTQYSKCRGAGVRGRWTNWHSVCSVRLWQQQQRCNEEKKHAPTNVKQKFAVPLHNAYPHRARAVVPLCERRHEEIDVSVTSPITRWLSIDPQYKESTTRHKSFPSIVFLGQSSASQDKAAFGKMNSVKWCAVSPGPESSQLTSQRNCSILREVSIPTLAWRPCHISMSTNPVTALWTIRMKIGDNGRGTPPH